MEKKSKKKAGRYVLAGIALVLVVLLALLPVLTSSDREASSLFLYSGEAARGSVVPTVAGGGTLREEKGLAVSVPSQVELTEYLVRDGDIVAEGDAVARADRVSVMTAIVETQEKLDELSEKLEEAADRDGTFELTAQTPARVKAVHGAAGDDVRAVMQTHGALAVLSLDGRMAVTFASDAAMRADQAVTVLLSDGTALDGRVESALGGEVTVTVTDDGPAIGEPVTVRDGAGTVLGEGELYVHSPWNAVAFAGEISRVRVETGQRVAADDVILELRGGEYSAEYSSLMSQRRAYENVLEDLFALYDDGTVRASGAGRVTGADDDALRPVSDSGGAARLMLLSAAEPTSGDDPDATPPAGDPDDPDATPPADDPDDPDVTPPADDPDDPDVTPPADDPDGPEVSPAPGGDDGPTRPDSANQLGMVIAIDADGSWTLAMQSDLIPASEYTEVGDVASLIGSMTTVTHYIPDAPIWRVSGGSRTQIGAGSVKAGDILLFAVDGEKVLWIDVIGHVDIPGTDTDGQGGSGELDWGSAGAPDLSGYDLSGYGLAGFDMSVLAGAYAGLAGMGGYDLSQFADMQDMYPDMTTQQQAVEGSLRRTVLSVVPQDTMTVEIAVDELDVSLLAPGQTAEVAVDALPGLDFEGTVVQVGGTVRNLGGNTKYPVTIRLERMDLMLDGMNASAVIPLRAEEGAVTIPVAALNDDAAAPYVYTSCDEQRGELGAPVYVTTGISDGERVEILSGLSEGDTFWYAVYDKPAA